MRPFFITAVHMKKQLLFALSSFFIISFSVQSADLSNLILKTISQHPDVMVEKAKLVVAETERDIALYQYYPTVSVSLENAAITSQRDTNFDGDNNVATLRVQQPLWTFGRLDAGYEKSEANVESQIRSIDETQLQLAQTVVQVWGEWFAAELRKEALQKSIDTHGKLRESVSRRAAQGASSPSEVRLTEARLAQIDAQYLNAQLQLDAARVKLEQLVGEPLPEGSSPQQALPAVELNVAYLTDNALKISPILQRFEAELRRSKAEIKERFASIKPEVYLRAEHQRGSYQIDGLPFSNRIFIGMESNFGAGLSASRQVALATAQSKTVEAEMKVVERQIQERVRLEITQLSLLEARERALQMSLKANNDIAEAFNRQYLAGRRSWVEVMNTARELAQAELELADLKAAKVLSNWRLSLLAKGLDTTLSVTQQDNLTIKNY